MKQPISNKMPYGRIPLEVDGKYPESKCKLPNKQEKKRLALLSTTAGLCILLFMLCQRLASHLIMAAGLTKLYLTDPVAQAAIEALLSIFYVFVPFAIGGIFCKALDRRTKLLPFNKPVSASAFVLAVFIGMLVMILSNYLTSVFVFFMDSVGVHITSPDRNEVFTGGAEEYFVYLLRGAVVPALIEEFALRGVVMQPLRRYGDRFAIVVSALIFALMHGNMVQAPFAFILGCAIGYFVIVTDTLWTGVAIHFITNAYAVTMSALASKLDYDIYFAIFTAVSVLMVLCGIAAAAVFIKRRREYARLASYGGVTVSARRAYTAQTVKVYALNPILIISIALMIYRMSDFISFGG